MAQTAPRRASWLVGRSWPPRGAPFLLQCGLCSRGVGPSLSLCVCVCVCVCACVYVWAWGGVGRVVDCILCAELCGAVGSCVAPRVPLTSWRGIGPPRWQLRELLTGVAHACPRRDCGVRATAPRDNGANVGEPHESGADFAGCCGESACARACRACAACGRRPAGLSRASRVYMLHRARSSIRDVSVFDVGACLLLASS